MPRLASRLVSRILSMRILKLITVLYASGSYKVEAISPSSSDPSSDVTFAESVALQGGSIYTGGVLNGIPHGVGTLTCMVIFLFVLFMSLDHSGVMYSGDFLYGKKSGSGIQTHLDGKTYEGEWADNDMSGQGVLRLPNGEAYRGSFSRGQHSFLQEEL